MFCQKNVLAKVAFARAISVARNRNDFVSDCRQKCTRHVSSGGEAGIRIPNCYRVVQGAVASLPLFAVAADSAAGNADVNAA